MSGAPLTLIVGTGLIGTSIALAMTRSGREVALEDRNPKALAEAIERGAGRALVHEDEPGLVVVAVPPASVPKVVAKQLTRYPNAIVTDVASVKAAPLREISSLVDSTDRFVGGHPMAGREVSGPGAARADLFEDRLWVVTPSGNNPPAAVDAVINLAARCGALVVTLPPEAHDRAVALTSHTPQLIASLLAAQMVNADPEDVAISGQGLRDATRLADSGPELWTEILIGNAGQVAAVVSRMADQLSDAANALSTIQASSPTSADAGDAVLLIQDLLKRGNQGRAVLPDKHGGAAHRYESIPVVVDDKPGELAKLFVAAGSAGINLEDVRIEHSVGRQRAVIELDVVPRAAQRLRETLIDGGWQIRG